MRFLPEWQKVLFEVSRTHGFEENPVGDIERKLLLAVGELVEAQNELRAGHSPTEIYYNADHPTKPEGFGIELADAVIRILNIAEGVHIDLAEYLELKHTYNTTRPFKHGKQF